MDATNVLDIALWSAQGFLALFFLAAGAPKVLGRGLERWTGFSELPRAQVVFTGFAEVLGAAGLVLPAATGVLPWLTPLAAVGLAIIGLMAAGFHVRADERLNTAETGLLAGIAAAVAIGRWDLLAVAVDVSLWVLVAALALLVPAAIINVIVLWKRSVGMGTKNTTSATSAPIPDEPSRAVVRVRQPRLERTQTPLDRVVMRAVARAAQHDQPGMGRQASARTAR